MASAMFAYKVAPLESAAEIVKDDCFISRHPGYFNTAVEGKRES